MGKYIVNIRETTDRIIFVGVKDGETYAGVVSVSCLTPYTEPEPHAEVTADAYQRGYEAGLNDKKEGKATCQYCEYEYLDETEEPCKKCCKAYMNKYKPKAKEEQIQVGDEVKLKCGVSPAIYMRGTNGSAEIYLLFNDGSCGIHSRSEIKCKTGRHFPELVEVLRKMKESDNG